MCDIRLAEIPGDLSTIRQLFREYADGLGFDLCFQDFEAELASLPGKYEYPAGRILLAWDGDAPIGCIAMRPIDSERCEMKRLYLRPEGRGKGVGRQLATRIVEEARTAGYARLYLDTIPSMAAAVKLYASMGFQRTTPYVFNPIPDALYLVLDLQQIDT